MRDLVIAAAVVLAVGLIGLILSFQGWRARGPDDDVMGAIVRAAALVEHGRLPAHGAQSDLLSYTPPGTAWLTVPGILVSSDARRIELIGSGGLYLGTLLGIFLLARLYFGTGVAAFAVVLYGFSDISIDLASHLWPRGHPFYYVWLVYLAGLWVDRRDGRYLAGAFLVWGAGMNEHFESAPGFFILPAVWWCYRPPIHWRALALASIVTLAFWSPYLTFQWQRGFIDVESQLLMAQSAAGCGARGGMRVRSRVRRRTSATPRTARAALPVAARELAWSAVARVPAVADLVLVNLRTRVLAGENPCWRSSWAESSRPARPACGRVPSSGLASGSAPGRSRRSSRARCWYRVPARSIVPRSIRWPPGSWRSGACMCG